MQLPAKKYIASFDIDAQNTFTPVCPDELPVAEGDQIADGSTLQAGQYFYVYPNPVTEENAEGSSGTSLLTKLVVEASLDGNTCYYTISLPDLQSNKTYTISSLTITRPGSDNPDEEITSGECPFCVEIYKGESFNTPFFCIIIMTKELIAAAYSDDHAVVFYIIPEILSDTSELVAYKHLLPVRSASEKYNVKTGEINGIFQGEFDCFRINSPPLAAFHHALNISSVSVEVQKIRV